MTKRIRIFAGSMLAAGLAFTSASAAEIKLKAMLNAASEVPANASTGKGTAELMLNDATKEISWTITYEGLTGDAVAAHIHGPAAAGANAGVVTSLGPMGAPFKSPLVGKATLTDAQVADVLAGKTYVNVHTAANKGGEVRGQIGK
ncbi:MAG: CHRD domain-containing protein [Rhodospirillaceae bacterium]|nr:CHRD domain-containing protein [Rhodospirillaceae bacterium]